MFLFNDIKMNLAILHKEVQDFIQENLTTHVTKLVLKGSPFSNCSIQELAEQLISKQKCAQKLPSWFVTNQIYYPNKLNIEQTSSEITANYKANLLEGNTIIDLTGGFGVDCFAFSKQFKNVTHCEINNNLSAIASHNYQQLGVDNIKTVAKDGIQYLTESTQTYDWIYIDPSRRDDLKQRVFLLKDCLPNVPKDIAVLFKHTNNIILKTAPLLDITAAINELKFVKEIHTIAVNNDVKEVLYILEKDYTNEIKYNTVNIKKQGLQVFNFSKSDFKAPISLPQKYLYEPNAAILKASAFNEICQKFSVLKIHKHSHLYTANELIDFPGRRFKINNIVAYNSKKLKQIIHSNKANISIRNFPETVAQIRKKTKLKDGGTLFLFFTTNANNERIVLICEKI